MLVNDDVLVENISSGNFDDSRAVLLGSLLTFTQVFYKLRTGREFVISKPEGRESHQITICRALTRAFSLQSLNLLINVPPGHGKSELLVHFVAWTMAHYSDSQFLYISYSHDLACEHTYKIKNIMSLPIYQRLFGIEIAKDTNAKDNFKTTAGGAVKAFGSAGSITGQDGGLPHLDRFSGAVLMDDMHKPDEVYSDVMRNKIKENYLNTIITRRRSALVPFIYIGHRTHEDDLPGNLIQGFDGQSWDKVILPAMDSQNNVLDENKCDREALLKLKHNARHTYWSQYQQNPVASGGGLYRHDDFVQYAIEPEIISTFITVDTAETDKNYNDATVLSFFGLYKMEVFGIKTEVTALAWLDCVEIRIEPKDLENEFSQFYISCMRHKVKPSFVAIEKKSTGTTLSSVLKQVPGMKIIDIARTRASGSKTSRFLEIQPLIAARRVSLPKYAKHTIMCIEHMTKITDNNSHRFDDICDTVYDAIKLALIDNVISTMMPMANNRSTEIARELFSAYNQSIQLKSKRYEASY